LCNLLKTMEPLVGFEPTTYSLRMNCSTPELQRLFGISKAGLERWGPYGVRDSLRHGLSITWGRACKVKSGETRKNML
jgi:hypothetical protein